ncbi:MAG: hypothetical protein OEZ58_20175 [Gammaproteobacteria bacterium]|nr:hypothetical protein [Gammaproteobacteria bacterium]MDH5731309.1 hypothetical protein [Gammaproteobacteria bacterium]
MFSQIQFKVVLLCLFAIFLIGCEDETADDNTNTTTDGVVDYSHPVLKFDGVVYEQSTMENITSYDLNVQAGVPYSITIEETGINDIIIKVLDSDTNLVVESRNFHPTDASKDQVIFVPLTNTTYHIGILAFGTITDPVTYNLKTEIADLSSGTPMAGLMMSYRMTYRFFSDGGPFTVDLVPTTGEANLFIYDRPPNDPNANILVGAFDTGTDSITMDGPTVTNSPYYFQATFIVEELTDYTIQVTQ